MAEGTPSPFPSERHRSDESPRGERSPGPREGGFRIRLSDNEMRSARALQEAFGLRSTVAVLGFALRALGQQLEEGKLEALVAELRSQTGGRGAPVEGGRSEVRTDGRSDGRTDGRTDVRRERSEGRGGGGRGQDGRGASAGGGRTTRVDPFARPPRPEATPEVPPETESAELESVETETVETETVELETAALETVETESAAAEPLAAMELTPSEITTEAPVAHLELPLDTPTVEAELTNETSTPPPEPAEA